MVRPFLKNLHLLLSLTFEIFIAFGVTNSTGFLINLALVLPFIIGCLTLKTNHQILLAQVLSVTYALIMMSVLVGIVVQFAEEGWSAPSNINLIIVAGSFVLAGILHPQEIACLPMGIIYFITIPSMYLFLVIYSLFNLNVVSWGTREVPKKKTAEEMEAEKIKLEEEAKKKELKSKGTILGALFGKGDSSLELGLKNLFSSQVSTYY